MSAHHCPQIQSASRYGAWASCRCGWVSADYRTSTGASYAWAIHVRDETHERKGALR